MTYQVPTTDLPDSLVVGDYWQWRVPARGDYPAASWTLSFAFSGPATVSVASGWTITAESAGTWLVQVTKTVSAGYTAGRYQWRAYVTSGSERYQIADGWVVFQPNIAVLAGDNRTHAQKMLALVEAQLEGRVVSGEESYSIGGRSITKMSTMELRRLRGLYAAEVYREQHQQEGLMSVGLNFVPPST